MIKQFAKLGLILAAFAGVACAGLAVVYVATKDQIAANAGKQLNESLKDLFAEAEEFAPESLESPDPAVAFQAAYVARRGGSPLGIAIKASGPSYGGDSVLLVGVGLDRRLVGVRVLENKDTPGLGANAASPTSYVDKAAKTTFPGQFAGKPISEAFEVKKDVQAITASTITSRALTKIVKAAGGAAGSWLERLAGGK
ncbi:MAG TPA: FMN-binding protein [Spirochaetales bacterium]|nr:FMN-binding protein [Spirochaetales bacterium]HRY53829.1 FMN-binding protein [Spirochaetia bacterium]HRZ65208.1 FMN-binding protein [Spirochaetia bacterium]